MEIEKRIASRDSILSRPLIEIQEQGTLIITEEFLNQLKYICSKISEVEWSGLIFFTTEGEPTNLLEFTITPYYIHLMDKGTSAYTEFDDDGSARELYDVMPELDPFEGNGYRYGKIHSHNTMQVFHSGTDIQDLQDQAEAYQEYYLSVIVNNFMDIEAKMAFVAEIPDQQINPKGFKNTSWKLPKKDVLVTVDFDIEIQGSNLTIPEALKDRLEEINVYKAPIDYRLNYDHNEWGGIPYKKGLLDSVEQDSFSDTDLSEYRTTQGKIAIRNFLHDYLEESVEITKVFQTICALTPTDLKDLKKEILIWFAKLPDWSRQNIVMYVSDVKIEIGEQNLDQLYESIWEIVKLEE